MIISSNDMNENTTVLINSDPTQLYEPGTWVGIGRNGLIYPLDHVAVLPPEEPGEDNTRPDRIGIYTMIVKPDTYEKHTGAPRHNVTKYLTCNKAGVKLFLGQSHIVEPLNTIHAGGPFKVIKSGADIGKLAVANIGDSYNCITEAVYDNILEVRIEFDTIPSSSSQAHILNTLDENNDGVVTRSEILDANEDGTNNWHDLSAIASNNVQD